MYHDTPGNARPEFNAKTQRRKDAKSCPWRLCGLATLRFIRNEGLVAHAESAGAYLRKQLLTLQSEFNWIGDVRGRGLMLGMEIVDPQGALDAQGHPPVDTARAKAFQQACLQHGLIVELGGRHGATVRFLPPLIITEQEIDFVAQILFRAASAISEHPFR